MKKDQPMLRGAAYFIAPALVLCAIWFTVFTRYYVPSPVISKEVIERGRQQPSNVVLEELSKFRFFDDENHLFTVEEAEKILQGQYGYLGEPPRPVHLPFDSADIDQGSPNWQLFHGRLVIPRILLAAYRETGSEKFFLMARDIILGWAAYERRALIPKGALWNDHAVAERVLALAEFWAVYRHHPSYNADVAEALFVFAARSGIFSADPTRFTSSSNHGVMQNLALWHLSLAFPSLPEASRYSQLAVERLRKQMPFYISEEGVVLEHSAGYQKTGVDFLSMAFRYMTLHGMDVPDEWRHTYEKTKEVYARLRRPDGSLPMFGDTEGGIHLPGPVLSASVPGGIYGPLQGRLESVQPQTALYPIGGYSIWWDGLTNLLGSTQTVVAWSYFPNHAHVHADEMSVLLWARGQTWWTNVGYWPYGTEERREAESWNGSNAPHLAGENVASPRKTRLLGETRSDRLSFIDLERTGPQGYVARRQVAQALGDLWVVLDYTRGHDKDRTSTLWTTAHDVEVREGQIPGSYILSSPSNTAVMKTFILSSSGEIYQYKGSRSPFAGWQMAAGEVPKPASAIMVEQPASDSWSVAIWSLDDARSQAKQIAVVPSMQSWKGPENWTIVVPRGSGAIRLSRESDKISLAEGGASLSSMLGLAASEGIDRKVAEIYTATEDAKREYRKPRVRDEIAYRFRMTYFAIALFVFQEVFFFAYERFFSYGYTLLRGLSLIGWILVGIWLTVIKMSLI